MEFAPVNLVSRPVGQDSAGALGLGSITTKAWKYIGSSSKGTQQMVSVHNLPNCSAPEQAVIKFNCLKCLQRLVCWSFGKL